MRIRVTVRTESSLIFGTKIINIPQRTLLSWLLNFCSSFFSSQWKKSSETQDEHPVSALGWIRRMQKYTTTEANTGTGQSIEYLLLKLQHIGPLRFCFRDVFCSDPSFEGKWPVSVLSPHFTAELFHLRAPQIFLFFHLVIITMIYDRQDCFIGYRRDVD